MVSVQPVAPGESPIFIITLFSGLPLMTHYLLSSDDDTNAAYGDAARPDGVPTAAALHRPYPEATATADGGAAQSGKVPGKRRG